MRYLILIIFAQLLLFSCSPKFVQLYKTTSKLHSTDSTYKFENDTVLVNYSFWLNRGIMAFSVYNKLSIPLYIDWKRSSFVSNIYKFNYWSDEVVTKTRGLSATTTNTYGGIFRYTGPTVVAFLAAGNSSTLTESLYVSKSVKPERITFIPPKSVIYKSTYYLTDKDYTDKSGAIQTIERREDKPKRKKTTIYSKLFNLSNTPLQFRNFMTISISEDFKKELYLDHEFYVSEIKFIDERHFEQSKLDSKGKTIVVSKYKKGIDFYRNPSNLTLSITN